LIGIGLDFVYGKMFWNDVPESSEQVLLATPRAYSAFSRPPSDLNLLSLITAIMSYFVVRSIFLTLSGFMVQNTRLLFG
jgi:hypothetical protein